jgi:hypothetical protein
MAKPRPLAFVAHSESLRRLSEDVVVLPLDPHVQIDSGHQIAGRPEDLLQPVDGEQVERETERIIEDWRREIGQGPFQWRGVNLVECFSSVFEIVVRDLLKTWILLDRVVEQYAPKSLLSDVPPLQGPVAPYPYLAAIGSLVGIRAKAARLRHDFLPADERSIPRKEKGRQLVRTYLRVNSRKALAVLRKERSLLAIGPHPDYYVGVASAWRSASDSTVVLTTERSPLRPAPRARLFVATTASCVDSEARKEIHGFVERAVAALDSMAPVAFLGERWREVWEPLRTDLRGRFESELPDLAAAGVAFEDAVARATRVLLVETASPFAKAVVRYAQRQGIPVTVIQHGILGGVARYRQTEGDRIAAWGPADAEWFRKNLGRRVIVSPTGSPRYDRLVTRAQGRADPFMRRIPPKAPVMVFASQPFVPGPATRSPWERRATIEMVVRAAKRLEGVVLLVKWHPAEKPEALPLAEFSAGSVLATQTANTFTLLRRAAAVLVVSSTVALEAMYLDRPVVFLGPPDPTSVFHPPEDGAGLRARTTDELVEHLRGVLFDKAFLQHVLEGQRTFVARDYAPPDGKAAERVVTLLRRA